jgi:hypothetical protein
VFLLFVAGQLARRALGAADAPPAAD